MGFEDKTLSSEHHHYNFLRKPNKAFNKHTKMMLMKVTLMALLGVAVADVSPYTSNYDPVQHHFGVRQDGVDPLVAGLGVGVLNAGYTTIVGLQNAAKTRDVCNKVNEVLNVADMPTTTVIAATTTTNAQLASTQTAITAIVNKINDILKKSTLS